MYRLTRTKRDTIWTKTLSKPIKAHQGVSRNGCPNYIKIEINKWLRRNQINKWLIPKHINTWSVISKGIKSTQQMIDKTPIENKIPIKTTKYQLGEKIPRRGSYLTEIKEKRIRQKGIKTPTININWNTYLWRRY